MSSINTHRLIYTYMRFTGRMLWYRPTDGEMLYHPHRRLLRCPPERLLDGLALASLAKHHSLGHGPVSTPPAGLETSFNQAKQHLHALVDLIDISKGGSKS